MTGLIIQDLFMSTIAGKVLREFGRVPEIGERVQFDGFSVTVLAMDGLRIARVRLERETLGEKKISPEG